MTYLVFRSSNGFRESEERQGEVHEAVLKGFQLLVTLNDLKQLKTHQAHYSSSRRGDRRNDLSSDKFTLG